MLFVRLTPNASVNQIKGYREAGNGEIRLKARVTVVPEKGRANKA
ncbi:MAG: DUF167 domain-containing protein, partial [Sneathiella sp.]|nr:DUF167 domain-containing protein [Sneathiella sp.]